MKGLISRIDIEKRISILFIIAGFIVGLISGLAKGFIVGLISRLGISAGLWAWVAFFLALFLFYITTKLIPKVFNLEEESLGGGTLKLLKLGFSPYWLIWLVFWIVSYNLTI